MKMRRIKLGAAVLGTAMVMFAVALVSPADVFATESDWDRADEYMRNYDISKYSIKFEYEGKYYVLPGEATAAHPDRNSVNIDKLKEALRIDSRAGDAKCSNPELFSVNDGVITSHQPINGEEWLKLTYKGKTYRITATNGGIVIPSSEHLHNLLYTIPEEVEPVKFIPDPDSYFFQKDPAEYLSGDYQSYYVQAGQNVHIDLCGLNLPGYFNVSSRDGSKPAQLKIENGNILSNREGSNPYSFSLSDNVICEMNGVSVDADECGISFYSEWRYPDSGLKLTNCRIKAISDSSNVPCVSLYDTKFEMKGGEISGVYGGLDLSEADCTMTNGTIRCASKDENADAVFLKGDVWPGSETLNHGTFIMKGGEIAGGNHGVHMINGARFTMNSGKISGNSRGVESYGCNFVMNGGQVRSNGCGVYCNTGYRYNVPKSTNIKGSADVHGKVCDFKVLVFRYESTDEPPLKIVGKMTNKEQLTVWMDPDMPDDVCAFTQGFAENNPGRDPAEVFLSVGEGREDYVVAKNHSGEAAFVKGRKVNFKANGGSGKMLVQQFPLDTGIKLLGNGFTRKGYRFTGWNTKADGSGKAYANKEIIHFAEADKDLTLYARWKLCTLTKAKVTGVSNKTYTGKKIKQSPVVTLSGKKLKKDKDYTISYKNNKNAGKAKMIITGKGKYTDSITKTFTIKKAANPLKVKAKAATVKYSDVKSKSKTLGVTEVIKTTKEGKGKITYKLASAKKGSKDFKKYFKVNKTKGKLTVKKGIKKGTYNVKVKVKAAGNKNYKSATKSVTIKIKVK